MADSFEDQAWVKMGIAAALETEYQKDQRAFVELLAITLRSILPDETEVKTRGLFKKSTAEVSVVSENNRYGIQMPEKGAVTATKTHMVRGIALKREPIPVDECLSEISAAIEARAAKSATTRTALANMLGLE